MDSRRDFLKKAAALAAAGTFPDAVRRALAIDPVPGSTFMDAEHVVILMQENRSFDHCYGSLRGVRGFNDPRAVTLPDGNPVWLQTNEKGETWAPFRLDLKGSNATWLGCLPHDWADQSKARNDGKHDRWLAMKRSGREGCADLPLTLGFHTRKDLPFYYALADAFTICDQNFCSSLTGTDPNRLHLWSGTLRPEAHPSSKAHIRNTDVETPEGVSWKSFPERLEEHGVSWRVYQNELFLHTGLGSAEASWLCNFGDNVLEFFSRYGVRYAPRHREYLANSIAERTNLLRKLRAQPRPWAPEITQQVEAAEQMLKYLNGEALKWTEAKFAKLTQRERDLHEKAFTTNEGDADFRKMKPVTYSDNGTERTMHVPAGDLFHQFRADVNGGRLPLVSWLVAPQVFSDHPDSPWYGAWYVAEVLDILTRNPKIWKKTVFILCYDENDGLFDHVPPFVPPDPDKPGSGLASPGLKSELEFVREAQEEQHRMSRPDIPTHAGPIGLGYRVPLVIASPWTRGGYVCSQVFDHTSILRFLEVWLKGKTARPVRETNITPWRRAICGDLTSVFRRAATVKTDEIVKVERGAWLTAIHRAQFRPGPAIPQPLTAAEIAAARKSRRTPALPRQEEGVRPACALPYELVVNGGLTPDRKSFAITFGSEAKLFAERSAGAPFHVYAPGLFRDSRTADPERGRAWAYAVNAGDRLTDSWPLAGFEMSTCRLRVHGPNGFYREFIADVSAPAIEVSLEPELSGDAVLSLRGPVPARGISLKLEDLSYGASPDKLEFTGDPVRHVISLQRSQGWYDFQVTAEGFPSWSQRFAGHIENGHESQTDPLMGSAV